MLHRTSHNPLTHARARSTRARQARRIVGAATAAAAAAAAVVGLAGQQASHAATNGPTAAYVDPTIADTNYPIPTNAYYVANDGSDTNPGTLVAPFATIHRALAVAPAGSTIVVRAGVYRESLGVIKRKVTLQAYPHEQAWVKGSVVATSFTQGANGWATPFTTNMCDSCYPSAALAPSYPAAGLPEQVFVDGAPLQQVTSAAALAPGTFWVDRANNQIWLADDPTGHTVEVTTLSTAFNISSLAAGTIIRGLGFEHWATLYDVTPKVAVQVTANNVTFDADTFAWTASRALGIYSANVAVTNSKFLDNGMNGVTGNKIGGLDFENNEVAFSNFEHWDITPSPYAQIAGIKLTGVANTVIRGNYVHDNYSNGVWFDVLSHDETIVGNTVTHNAGHGIAVEVSGHSIIAGNTVAENARDGVKISGANDVEVWNNTVVDNGWAQLGVYEDPRHTPAPATSDTTNVRVANNIFQAGASSTKYVWFNLDISNPKHLTFFQMVSSDDHNDWGRTNSASPKVEFSTQATLAKGGRYNTLADFSKASGRERASTSTDSMDLATLFTDPDNGDYSVLPTALPLLAAPATLPTAVAAALGSDATPAHIGATGST